MKSIRRTAAVLVMVFSLGGTVAAVSPPDPTSNGRNAPRVLVIHSYYPTFTWSNRITHGIQSGFSESEFSHADLHFEYMDAKRHPGSTYLNQYAEFLKAKYPHPEEIDLIICSDDQALNFLLARSSVLFPGVPLVFCAVNGYDAGMHRHGRAFTGVIEAIAPAETLDVALELQKDIRQVLVITDVTVTGRAIERMAREIFRPYEEKLAFRYVSDLSMAELQREVSALPQQAIGYGGDKQIIYSLGCVGHGVSMTHLNGRTLADLALERKTDLTDVFFVNRRTIPWPPQPLRHLTIKAILGYMHVEDRFYDAGRAE